MHYKRGFYNIYELYKRLISCGLVVINIVAIILLSNTKLNFMPDKR